MVSDVKDSGVSYDFIPEWMSKSEKYSGVEINLTPIAGTSIIFILRRLRVDQYRNQRIICKSFRGGEKCEIKLRDKVSVPANSNSKII